MWHPSATLLLLAALLSGCDLPYYWQAAGGQWDLMQKRQPIDDLLADPTTPDATKARLRYSLAARAFALDALPLDDNGSYLDYVALDREYVSWNVFATTELSMDSHTWCYPIAGCVSYRGYFDEARAHRYADALAAEGYDTYVGGVGAYSTLGWFDDPVLSTFLARGDLSLAALLFHELAHQVLYVPDDTEFNESFATSIETILLERWIDAHDLHAQWPQYQAAKARQTQFVQLILRHQAQRRTLFEAGLPADQTRQRKHTLIAELRADYADLKAQWGGFSGYDQWFSGALNNAQLNTVAAYHGLLPGFLALYQQQQQRLPDFIEHCRSLAALSKEARHQRLIELASRHHQLY